MEKEQKNGESLSSNVQDEPIEALTQAEIEASEKRVKRLEEISQSLKSDQDDEMTKLLKEIEERNKRK